MTFILSTETVNRYGFWILTSGLDLRQFKKNPVMYWMHRRPSIWEKKGEQMLPIGRWENIRVEKLTDEQVKGAGLEKELIGTKAVLADAVFDEKEEFAAQIKSKVEGGFIRMASLGVESLENSHDPKLLKDGQKLATMTKGLVLEASIVDRGGNNDAVMLYDSEGGTVNLSDESQNTIPKLKNKADMLLLTDQTKTILGLSDGYTPEEIEKAVKLLKDKADMVEPLEAELKTMKEAEESRAKAEFTALVDSKELRLTADEKEVYNKLYANDQENTVKLLKQLPKRNKLSDFTKTDGDEQGRENWTLTDWSKKDPKGLAKIRKEDRERYRQMVKDDSGRSRLA